ncbi:MAG: MEKHLA domain-containing protein [Gammaproteobacteria bacterium]
MVTHTLNTGDEPAPDNAYQQAHACLLLRSFEALIGRPLLPIDVMPGDQPRALYEASFAVVSHDTGDDPVFNYANRTAQRLFEMSWSDFTALPSRLSAEAVNRAERARLLERVSRDGFIDDYSGVRIAASGARFRIEAATVWNVLDGEGRYRGQAAVFHRWTPL